VSIVLHGFGLPEIDSSSSLVAFGLARDLEPGETIEQAVAFASIENLFVIDFGAGQRKPTGAEYRRFKRMVKMMQTGQMHFREKPGKRGGIEYWADRTPIMRKAA
jgi:hypothetical protein